MCVCVSVCILRPVAVFSHPSSVPQPETREVVPDVTKRDPSPADVTVHRHSHPDPSASVKVRQYCLGRQQLLCHVLG